MKPQIFRVTTTLAVLVLLAFASVSAQAGAKAEIPFQFKAGSTTFPAGEYIVDRIALANNLLLIQSTDCRESAVLITNALQGNPEKSKLVFHR